MERKGRDYPQPAALRPVLQPHPEKSPWLRSHHGFAERDPHELCP